MSIQDNLSCREALRLEIIQLLAKKDIGLFDSEEVKQLIVNAKTIEDFILEVNPWNKHLNTQSTT